MIETLVALIVGLVGAFLFQRSKTKSAEAINDNLEIKEDLLEKKKEIIKNQGLIEAEEQKREEIKNDEKNPTLIDIADYINRRK